MKKRTLVMFAALALTACGGTTEGGDTSKAETPTVTVASDSGGSSAGDSEETPSSGSGHDSTAGASDDAGAAKNVSCEDACTNATNWCGADFGSYEDCVSVCPDMGQSALNCIGTADDCDAVVACLKSDADAGSGDTTSEPEATSDVGDTCRENAECSSDACVVGSNETDVAGYCSKTCDDFTDCPEFWECTELGNAAGKYCVQE